jgi:hypothetical protein
MSIGEYIKDNVIRLEGTAYFYNRKNYLADNDQSMLVASSSGAFTKGLYTAGGHNYDGVMYDPSTSVGDYLTYLTFSSIYTGRGDGPETRPASISAYLCIKY